ncbi:MAG: flagellar basal body-associated FliL family protein [Azoarcus sp.]|nr:flagellar basal body-associated FliL family protein [Azoarcus sp.]
MPPAKQPTLDDAEAPKKKRGLGGKLLTIVVIVLVVLAIGAGVVVWLLLQKKNDLAGDGTESVQEPAAAQVSMEKPPTFVALDPFVVNLQPESGERYLQVIMAMRVADEKTAQGLSAFMPEIRHRINLRLTGKLPSEISTPPGQEQLAGEIAADINAVLGSPAERGPTAIVHSVLFNSFIIQ